MPPQGDPCGAAKEDIFTQDKLMKADGNELI